jgi:hypothetical protein
VANEEELIGGVTLAREIFPRIEPMIARAPRDHWAEFLLQAGEETMRQDDPFKPLHDLPPLDWHGSPRPLR